MIDKFIFNEDIKRVFNCITNNQIVFEYILKDYISDIKIVNDIKKKEKFSENSNNLNTNNSKSIVKYNDSSQNLIQTKANNSIHFITPAYNSFLYLNSSFKSLSFDKLEGLIIECKWKKKYILYIKIAKIISSDRFCKSIEIECLEMNHLENAFNFQISLFWNSTNLQTIVLTKFITKIKIIEEIINREYNNIDKKIIYDNLCNYLSNDLTNIEHCSTSLIFAHMKDISLYLSDIKKLTKLSNGIENKRIETYTSPLISSMQNCRVYDNLNNLCQEFILTGFYVTKNHVCQIGWEKRIKNKIFCVYRISIIYLEENLSLLAFRNIWHTHVASQLVSEVNNKKKLFFDEIINYFIKKNGLMKISKNIKDLNLKIGVKSYKNEENNQINLDMIMHNEGIDRKDTKNKENDIKYDDSLILNNSDINNDNSIKGLDNLFTDTIQNISEIQNINSYFLGQEDENNY